MRAGISVRVYVYTCTWIRWDEGTKIAARAHLPSHLSKHVAEPRARAVREVRTMIHLCATR
jgi:hypothetical protein